MIKTLSDDQLAALLRAARERRHCNAARDASVLLLLAASGMRPGEAVRLTCADFRLTDHDPVVRVRRLKKRRIQGVIDDVPLSRHVARAMRPIVTQRAAAGGPAALVFPLSVRQLERVFDYYARRAGLPDTFTLYCLRHTAGTRAYAATGDVRMVQALLGHADVKTSAVYAHVTPDHARRVIERVTSTL